MSNNRSRWASVVAAFVLLVVLCAGGAAEEPSPQPSPTGRGSVSPTFWEGLGEDAAATGRLIPNFAVRGHVTDAVMDIFVDAVADPAGERLYLSYSEGPYLADGPTLHVIDTRQVKRIATLSGPNLDLLALTPDGSRLIGHTSYPTDPGDFRVYDTATLQFLGDFPVTCAATTPSCWPADMAVGPGGRLYWLAYRDTLLTIIDLATGAIIDRFTAAEGAAIDEIEIVGDQLFVFESGEENPTPLARRYRLSADALPVAELTAPLGYERELWRASPDGTALLALQDGGLIQFDGDTLQYVRVIASPNQFGVLEAAFAPDSHTFYGFAYHPNPFDYYQQYLVTSYDTATGARRSELQLDLRGVPYVGFGNPVLPLAGGEVAIALTSGVYILHAMQYATALPVGLSDFCAAAVNDDFSQPDSGWPIDDLGAAAVGYEAGEYFIRLTAPDLWFGVSRGDPWRYGSQVEITTHALGEEGYSGLVFGIQPGWSEFYTFEVFPAMQRWAIFHYTAAAGWEVVETNPWGLIDPDGQGARLSIEQMGDNRNVFRINGAQATFMDNVDGRVGLSAGSLDEPFEARYDDYFFAGPHCPRPLRAGDIEFAPPISRPPIETFLEGRESTDFTDDTD